MKNADSSHSCSFRYAPLSSGKFPLFTPSPRLNSALQYYYMATLTVGKLYVN